MQIFASLVLVNILWALAAGVQGNIKPETVTASTMATPAESWFMVRDGLGSIYLFDAATAQMHGLLSLTHYTPAVEPHLAQNRFYAAESYYSRGTRGERTDVVTLYDAQELAPLGEIRIPNKIAALPFRRYIALLDDERHLAVFNMTPAQSVSIVDVQDKSFVDELATPGCALVMPAKNRSFLQLCGDGTVQKISLNGEGKERRRQRSTAFFDVKKDPVFDKPVRTSNGWLVVSYLGQVFELTATDKGVDITQPWSMLTQSELEAGWRPGGGQLLAYHAAQDLLFVLMNDGGEFSQDDAGKEVWVYRRSARQRIARLDTQYGGTNVFVTSSPSPQLVVSGEDTQVHIYDVATLREVHTIAEVGRFPGYLQGFGDN